MPKKIDESVADEAAKPAADESVADAAQTEQSPDDFDLLAWLEGIGPVRYCYPLGGGRVIELRSRTPDWTAELAKAMEGEPEDAQARAYVAGHIVDERITPENLAEFQRTRPLDWAELYNVAFQIDTRPSSQVQPRFARCLRLTKNRWVRDALVAAREWRVPPRRMLGMRPLDQSEVDRLLMLALTLHDLDKCPCGCGGYADVTLAVDGWHDADSVTCDARRAMDEHRKAQPEQPGELLFARYTGDD